MNAMNNFSVVLILVLMEDTLRAAIEGKQATFTVVLILVLMEDTLRADKDTYTRLTLSRLNPCFNGRYSQSVNVVPQENYVRVS